MFTMKKTIIITGLSLKLLYKLYRENYFKHEGHSGSPQLATHLTPTKAGAIKSKNCDRVKITFLVDLIRFIS